MSTSHTTTWKNRKISLSQIFLESVSHWYWFLITWCFQSPWKKRFMTSNATFCALIMAWMQHCFGLVVSLAPPYTPIRQSALRHVLSLGEHLSVLYFSVFNAPYTLSAAFFSWLIPLVEVRQQSFSLLNRSSWLSGPLVKQAHSSAVPWQKKTKTNKVTHRNLRSFVISQKYGYLKWTNWRLADDCDSQETCMSSQ